jgi:hypothetical protein
MALAYRVISTAIGAHSGTEQRTSTVTVLKIFHDIAFVSLTNWLLTRTGLCKLLTVSDTDQVVNYVSPVYK